MDRWRVLYLHILAQLLLSIKKGDERTLIIIYSLLTTVWALYNHSSCLGTLTNVLVWAMFHKKIRQKEIHLLRHGISIFSELKELTESRRTEDPTD